MASRRQFAHKLLSPLTIILGAAETLARQAPDLSPDMQELLELLREEARRLEERLQILVQSARVQDDAVTIRWEEDVAPSEEEKGTDSDGTSSPDRLAPPTKIRIAETAAPAVGQILVVESDPAVQRELRQHLQSEGYHVDLAGNGIAAIDRARLHPPDLILLGQVLSGVDNHLLYTVLHEDPNLTEIPVVLLSAPADKRSWSDRAIPWIVPRPVQRQQLLETVAAAMARPRPDGRPTILIVDDEEGVRLSLGRDLSRRGYHVETAASGEEALTQVARLQPEVILLDIFMPHMDGLEVLQRLRNQAGVHVPPVILLSVMDDPSVKARGLRLGADDYVCKPYSSVELEARIESILRRKELEYSLSPSTRLPGNIAIERVLKERIAAQEPCAICYADLDRFKAYNDTYGFLKGDGVIHQTARILVEAVRDLGDPDDFIGHVGGDDFVLVTIPQRIEAICQRIVHEFDQVIPLYYDADARERGYIEAPDRQGQSAIFPLMTISLVYVTTEQQSLEHPGQVIDQITELKQQAKRIPGSTILSQ